jgi:hypothetical protein
MMGEEEEKREREKRMERRWKEEQVSIASLLLLLPWEYTRLGKDIWNDRKREGREKHCGCSGIITTERETIAPAILAQPAP